MKRFLATAVCLLTAPPALAQHSAPASTAFGAAQYATAHDVARSGRPAIHPAVARIVAPGDGSVSYGSGTLVYVNDEFGIVITNWHVVNEATGPISVHFPNGFYSLGTVQQIDRDWDLAAVAIRKPDIQPVALADEAPRPGEVLTIAGYGSGNYRAASGPCTQYVAPGTQFPFEMVEVAVSARQGDSGGPIFNEQGQLAGVLFGEGHGRTSGSYCGRVRWFLTSVVREVPSASAAVAAAPLQPVPTRPPDADTAPEPQAVALATPTFSHSSQQSSWSQAAPFGSSSSTVAAVSAAGPDSTLPQTTYVSWEDVAGHTLAEQAKTVLAILGMLALILHGLRWMSTESAKT